MLLSSNIHGHICFKTEINSTYACALRQLFVENCIAGSAGGVTIKLRVVPSLKLPTRQRLFFRDLPSLKHY